MQITAQEKVNPPPQWLLVSNESSGSVTECTEENIERITASR